MAQKKALKKGLKKKILNYIALLEKEGIYIKKAIVFGSYAKGRVEPWSDIDLCLVSEQFGKDIFREGVKVSRLARRVEPLIEPHPYHPADLKEKYDPLAAEIRKHGIVVFLV